MATHGKFGPFNPKSEPWACYSERLRDYFTSNEIADPKKHAILLTVIGPQTFQLLRNLVQPKKLEDFSYDQLIEILTKHYDPAPSQIMQRYKFHTRERGPSESIANYVAELKSIGGLCRFQDTLPDMLRDRLVCGVNDGRIQRALLQEHNLTFERALEIAQSIEAAANDMQRLKIQPSQDQIVHRVYSKQTPTTSSTTPCYRCGSSDHQQTVCRFRSATCRACGKKGHIAKVCRSKQQQRSPSNTRPQQKTVHLVSDNLLHPTNLPSNHQPSQEAETYSLFSLQQKHKVRPLMVSVQVNNTPVCMEVDTGAALSLVNEATYLKLARRVQLKPATVTICTYTGEALDLLGMLEVQVQYQSQKAKLPLLVVKGSTGPNLLGRDWLQVIRLNWTQINHMNSPKIDDLLQKFPKVFQPKIGLPKGTRASIYVPHNTKPRYFRPRSKSYFLCEKVDQELQRLQKEGIIEPIQFSDWAAPIVPILKADGHHVHICGDYKVTINQVAKLDGYPLPKIEDIFSKLSGGTIFTKLDLTSAYQQIPLDEESKRYTTINTPRGLFRYNRLPFGIASAPAIFQQIMENLLVDIPNVSVYLDDILVTGKNQEDHNNTLERVLQRLQEAGLTLKQEKCQFAQAKVEYLGHVIDKHGLHPSPQKVKAVQLAPVPKNVTELKSFIGFVNFYNKFLPNLSCLLNPLYRLLQKGVQWNWSQEQQTAFEKTKELLQSASVLIHYDPSRQLALSADASPYGIGGVLSHIMDDGSERPIAYTSRSLSSTEQRYSQLDKEGLAIIFCVKKFHQFLQGRSFVIYSDHQPLKYLFDSNRPTPVLASGRIQRWALMLGSYQYVIQYRPGTKMAMQMASVGCPSRNHLHQYHHLGTMFFC